MAKRNASHWQECRLTEAYEVLRTVEVIMGERNYRIEVLRGYWNPATPFTARCYVREDVTVQPTYPQTAGGFARTPRSSQLWLGYDLPWTARDSADGALAQGAGLPRRAGDKEVILYQQQGRRYFQGSPLASSPSRDSR